MPDVSSPTVTVEGRKREALTDDSLLAYIRTGGVSFVELTRHFDGAEGDQEMGLLDRNIIFWQGVSAELIASLKRLQESGLIRMKPTQLLVYAIDGAILRMPLARSGRRYAKPRWLPVTFDAVRGKEE